MQVVISDVGLGALSLGILLVALGQRSWGDGLGHGLANMGGPGKYRRLPGDRQGRQWDAMEGAIICEAMRT